MPAATRIAAGLAVAALATPAEAQIWNPFRAKPPEAAAPAQPAKLSEESGPWSILATTFSGEGAEAQAEELAEELRGKLGRNAYVHQMTFDLKDEGPVGRGVDRYGAPIRMRYRSGAERKEWAVLIGDYPAVDDPVAEKDLAAVKLLRPKALEVDADGGTRQNLAFYRQGVAQATQEGPMRAAFLTRNPLLPDEFFVPKGVDKFVEKMNKGLDHSALGIDGRYTVKVATFRGRGTLLGATQARSKGTRRKQDAADPLVEAAENAHLLCEAMREAGWDAYEFHDRDESWVSVGSFERVTDASGAPLADVAEIVRTFGAAYDTPVTPLEKKRVAANTARVAEVKQTFNRLFNGEVGQVATGLNPKYAQVEVSRGEPLRPVPFDIHPHVVEAPKRSVSSGFAWRR